MALTLPRPESVEIDGIRLTAAQIDRAVERLYTPPKALEGGMVVEDTTEPLPRPQYMVVGVDSALGALVARAGGALSGADIWLTDGRTLWRRPVATLVVVGVLAVAGAGDAKSLA